MCSIGDNRNLSVNSMVVVITSFPSFLPPTFMMWTIKEYGYRNTDLEMLSCVMFGKSCLFTPFFFQYSVAAAIVFMSSLH